MFEPWLCLPDSQSQYRRAWANVCWWLSKVCVDTLPRLKLRSPGQPQEYSLGNNYSTGGTRIFLSVGGKIVISSASMWLLWPDILVKLLLGCLAAFSDVWQMYEMGEACLEGRWVENYQIYSRLDISKANSNGGNDLKIFVLQQIESSLKNVTLTEKGPSASEVARLNAEKKLFGNQRERIVAEMQRYSASKDPRLRSVAARSLSSRLEFELCTSVFIVMTADISTGVIFPPIVNTIFLYFTLSHCQNTQHWISG